MRVCVYCSSSTALDTVYRDVARRFGVELAARGHALVYGGGNIGLMGIVARAVRAAGGHVTGVIPHALRDLEIADEACDELILTRTMRERKQIMEDRADAFVTLPGGIGTLEELLEILTLKQLRYHDRAIVILNVDGYFDSLLAQFDRAVDERFARPAMRELYRVETDVAAALDYLADYRPSGVDLRDLVPALTEAAVDEP